MKKLLSLAVAAAMVTSLCACGGGSSTTATTAAAANSGSAESGSAAAADGKNYDNVTLKLSYATEIPVWMALQQSNLNVL